MREDNTVNSFEVRPDFRSTSRLLCGFFVLVLSGFILSGCAKNPVTGNANFMMMSQDEGIRTGQKIYPRMTQMNGGELPDRDLQEYVQNLGDQLAAVSHNPDLPFEFNVVNTSTPNAYALPGGFITVTRGLLLEMDREAQLAGVLGHEIVHATARHSAQQQSQGLVANILLTAGSVYLRTEGVRYGGLYEDLGALGAQAYLATYSRSQERQADRVGMRYAAKAGYDPEGMIGLQEILLRLREEKPNAVQQIFSTHPLSEERIQDARDQLEEIRSEVDGSNQNRLQKFQTIVAETWKPRKPAYEHLDEGIRKLEKGRVQPALEAFRTARERFDEGPLIRAWYGRALTEAGRWKEGRRELNRALSIDADNYRVRLFSGINYLRLGKHARSLEDLNEADRLLEGTPPVLFFKGRNYEELGNREQAAELYIQYLKRVPEGEQASYARARLRDWGY